MNYLNQLNQHPDRFINLCNPRLRVRRYPCKYLMVNINLDYGAHRIGYKRIVSPEE